MDKHRIALLSVLIAGLLSACSPSNVATISRSEALAQGTAIRVITKLADDVAFNVWENLIDRSRLEESVDIAIYRNFGRLNIQPTPPAGFIWAYSYSRSAYNTIDERPHAGDIWLDRGEIHFQWAEGGSGRQLALSRQAGVVITGTFPNITITPPIERRLGGQIYTISVVNGLYAVAVAPEVVKSRTPKRRDREQAARHATTRLARPLLTPPAFNAASTAFADATSVSWSHTVSGSDRLLIMGISTSDQASVTGMTYAGTSLTNILATLTSVNVRVQSRSLVAPATGTNTATITIDIDRRITGRAHSYTGVHQTTPLGTVATATGTSTAPSVAVSGTTDDLVEDEMGWNSEELGTTASVGPGQTQRTNNNDSPEERGASSTEPGAASVTMSWTLSASRNWAIIGVAVKPSVVAAPESYLYTASIR